MAEGPAPAPLLEGEDTLEDLDELDGILEDTAGATFNEELVRIALRVCWRKQRHYLREADQVLVIGHLALPQETRERLERQRVRRQRTARGTAQ